MIVVRVAESAADRIAAVHRCADVLEEVGAVEPSYRSAMVARERSISTYMGEGVAIPHGIDASHALIRHEALAVLRFPDGIDWAGHRVTVCVAIAAGDDDGQLDALAALAAILLDPARAAALRSADRPDLVVRMLCGDRPGDR
jgi:PTS system mannitol-specific IIA component